MRYALIPAAIMIMAAPAALAQAQKRTATEYLQTAGSSDLYERQSSQLALTKSKDERVRTFATRMVADHSKSTADLVAAAKSAGITPPPPQLNAKHSKLLGELRPLSGQAFDRAYLTQQTMAHQEALALHKGYAANGDQPALRAAAAKIAPVVQHHLEMLNKDEANGGAHEHRSADH